MRLCFLPTTHSQANASRRKQTFLVSQRKLFSSPGGRSPSTSRKESNPSRNNGLGKETVLHLAKHQPRKIFLAARNEQNAKNATEAIQGQLSEKVDIEYLPLDLTSLRSVKDAAGRFESRSDRLDILVLNAGVMAMPMSTTDAGFEIHMATNHVGHHLLTKLLLPILEKTAAEPGSDVRVVCVSSERHRLAPPIETIVSASKLSSYSSLARYAASKAANIMFAAELARRHPRLTPVSVHPGIIMTNLHRTGQESGDFILSAMKATSGLMTQSVADGALTQLWCAAGARKEELTSGGYYTVETLREWNAWVNDERAAKMLWEWTETELARAGF